MGGKAFSLEKMEIHQVAVLDPHVPKIPIPVSLALWFGVPHEADDTCAIAQEILEHPRADDTCDARHEHPAALPEVAHALPFAVGCCPSVPSAFASPDPLAHRSHAAYRGIKNCVKNQKEIRPVKPMTQNRKRS